MKTHMLVLAFRITTPPAQHSRAPRAQPTPASTPFVPAFASLSRPRLLNLTCGENGRAILGFVVNKEAFVTTGAYFQPTTASSNQLFVLQYWGNRDKTYLIIFTYLVCRSHLSFERSMKNCFAGFCFRNFEPRLLTFHSFTKRKALNLP